MTYFIFILKGALFDFSRNKGRTLLTSLGILIGVFAVVLLIAFGLGLKKYIEDQFNSLGTNLLRVLPGQVIQNGNFRASPGSFGGVSFEEKDITRLKRVKDLEYIVPVYTKTSKATANGKTEVGDIFSTSSDIFPSLNLNVAEGRAFTKNDNDKRVRVVVLGPKLAEKLFQTANDAVGNSIKIAGQSFKVVGVLESKGGGSFGGPDLDSYMYIPYRAGYIFNSDKKFVTIILKTKDNADLASVKKEVTQTLLYRLKEDDFSVVEQTEILNAVSSIFGILNSVLVAIAAISLIVGGIGIMNIMYVTVTERIKEIGIRRALGARNYDILYQFIIESVILSLFGGSMGILLAFIVVLFIQKLFPAYIDLNSVLLALGVSTTIGVVFGVLPAKKAADLSPIDAIRYE